MCWQPGFTTFGAGDFFGDWVLPVLLFTPLLMIPYLIILSKYYVEARDPQNSSRATFVIGFCIVNLCLWGGSCAIIFNLRMTFH